jgi:DNA-binding MarR family transcriptional regulator
MSKQERMAVAYLGEFGASKMVDLADYLGVVQSAVTPLIDKLQEKGLVSRRRSEEDRRVWLTDLTEKGLEVYGSLEKAFEELAQEILGPLSVEERNTFIELFERVAGHWSRSVDSKSLRSTCWRKI